MTITHTVNVKHYQPKTAVTHLIPLTHEPTQETADTQHMQTQISPHMNVKNTHTQTKPNAHKHTRPERSSAL